jgi:hypothetical protein
MSCVFLDHPHGTPERIYPASLCTGDLLVQVE